MADILKRLQTFYENADCNESLYDVGQAVDELKRLYAERRWIPVSERLPDDEAEALIAFEDRSIGVAYAVFHHVEEDGSQKWTDGNGFELKQPTHWMPLPEPPEVK
jgi:hypothetical protein